MKKYFYSILFVSIALFTLFSCKEDISLTGKFDETAIVYGLLDQSENDHVIKINRAFIGPGNALEIAKIPDSSYFSSVDAIVSEYIGTSKTREWKLEDTIISNKSDQGVFYAPSSKVYHFRTTSSEPLKADAIYKIEITLYKGTSKEFKVNGETELVSGITSSQSNPSSSFDFIDNTGKIQNSGINVANTGNARIMNASLVISYDEFQDNTLINTVNYTWNTGESQVESNSTFSSPLSGTLFYQIIKDNVTKNSDINKRQLKTLTIILTGGSQVLNDYINANKPSSSLAQTKPSYTNLTVTNGKSVVGIFASRYTAKFVKEYYKTGYNPSCLSQSSRKELCTGTITGNLFFCSNHKLDDPNSNPLEKTIPYCP